MLTRRDFCRTTSVVAASSMMLPNFTFGQASILPLYKIIADENFELSTAFAQHAAARGANVHVGSSDITSLWFHDLEPRWRHTPLAIAGLTTPEALFCLEQLARDHGMRVVTRAEHRMRNHEVIEHSIYGPSEVVSCMDYGCKTTTAWPATVADALLTFPSTPRLFTTTTIAQNVAREQRLNDTLVSWLIALPHRA